MCIQLFVWIKNKIIFSNVNYNSWTTLYVTHVKFYKLFYRNSFIAWYEKFEQNKTTTTTTKDKKHSFNLFLMVFIQMHIHTYIYWGTKLKTKKQTNKFHPIKEPTNKIQQNIYKLSNKKKFIFFKRKIIKTNLWWFHLLRRSCGKNVVNIFKVSSPTLRSTNNNRVGEKFLVGFLQQDLIRK